MFFDKILKKKKEKKILSYVENELSKTLFIMDPIFFKDGTFSNANLEALKESKTIPIISVDRNVFSDLLAAVKKGSFDSCKNRKEITSFLFWTEKNDIALCPYDAINENAFIQKKTSDGNKEKYLFDYLYDNVGIDVVIDSFFDATKTFIGKNFNDAIDDSKLDFSRPTSDFLFLYASILHLVYLLRTETKKEEQYVKLLEWYFEESLVSIFALTYIVLLFCKEGITPPHHYLDDDKVIQGCKNEAMDLLYMQEIDPRRYPSNEVTLIIVTHDRVMKDVFCTVTNEQAGDSIEDYLLYLCSFAPESKRDFYYSNLIEKYRSHKTIKVTPQNAFDVSSELAKKEELLLMEILKPKRELI